MPSNFGSLNYRCALLKPVTTQESLYGETVTKWKSTGTIHCGVTDIMPRNDENVSGRGDIVSPQRAKLRVRYSSAVGITAEWRVLLNRNGSQYVYKVVSEGSEVGYRDAIEFQIERMLSDSETILV